MMWEFLKNLFGMSTTPIKIDRCVECNEPLDAGGFCPDCDEEDEDEDEDEEEEEEEEEEDEKTPLSILALAGKPMKSLAMEAFQEVSNEIAKKERELLDDEKLKGYVKDLTKKMFSDAITNAGASSSIILLTPSRSGVPMHVYSPFFQILSGVYKEMGISMRWTGDEYFVVERKDVIKALEKLRKANIKVDERVRMLLSSGGPYR